MPGLPVDDRAVAVEREDVEARQVQGHRRRLPHPVSRRAASAGGSRPTIRRVASRPWTGKPCSSDIRTGYDAVVEALAGATDEDLDRKPPDGWTARMAVHHLADSEATAYVRLRRIIAEDDAADRRVRRGALLAPTPLRPADRAVPGGAGLGPGVEPASCSSRSRRPNGSEPGAIPNSGPYSVDDWLRIYAAHSHDHADQIRRARRGES